MTVVVTHSTPADGSFSATGATAWNADHTLSGVGTMAEQNKTSVDIEGGTIDNTPVGATTPAAGTFTTLTATTSVTTPIVGAASGSSTTGLDLSVNSKAQARLVEVGDGTRPLIINGGSAGGAQITGITANAILGISAGGGNPVSFYTNGRVTTEQFRVAHTASAVNYVQVTGSATLTGAPTLSAQGSDANIPMRLMFKGNGGGSGGGIQLVNASGWNGLSVQTVNNPNWINIAGVASGSAPVISALGSDTNIPLVLQPKGTGALQAQQTDSTATGGNARGTNSVDWQTVRGSAANVASNQSSVIGGGQANQASGFISVVAGGNGNFATGVYGAVLGGTNNSASGFISEILGGQANTAAGYYNLIGGGFTNSGTSGSAVTTQSATMNGTTAVTLSGSNASIKVGQYISGTSIAGDTYVAAISGTSLTLSKNASGSSTSTLSFYTPHGVVVGGGNNQATGSYSFIGGGGDAGTAANRNLASGDWSAVVGGKNNTASGPASFIGGGGTWPILAPTTLPNVASAVATFIGAGLSNTASGDVAAVVGGQGNTASGARAFVGAGLANTSNAISSAIIGGSYGTTRAVVGNHVFPACDTPVATASGVSQGGLLVLGTQTTDATATVLRSNTSAAGTTNQVILPNNSAYFFKGEVIAGVTGGGNTKGWTIEGVIKRGANAASTTVVGVTVMSSYGDAGAVTWTIAAAADTTNGGLKITATGQAATTIRWVCKIETTEMTY